MTTPAVDQALIAAELKSKVAELEQSVLHKHPNMPGLLREIWMTIKKYPEQVTLLEEDDIRKVVDGLKVQTGVEFVATATKGGGSKSAIANIKKLGAAAF